MFRRPSLPPPDDDRDELAPRDRPGRRVGASEPATRDLPDLSTLAIAGLTRRRLAAILGTLLTIWIVVVFARQVGDASTATARAQQMALDNVALAADVAGYERELGEIQQARFYEQQARAYRVGTTKEIAFTLAADAPPLPEDAPGSASVRLGAPTTHVTPLERWLTLLFGPAD
jgi:hypothetical protein